MTTKKSEAKNGLQDNWLSLFRCCSRDPKQIDRMLKATKGLVNKTEKETTKN